MERSSCPMLYTSSRQMCTEELLVPWFRKVIPLFKGGSVAGFPQHDTLNSYSEGVWIYTPVHTGVSVRHNS